VTTERFRVGVQTPYLGMHWPLGRIDVGADLIVVEVPYLLGRGRREVRHDQAVDIRLVRYVARVGVGFARGGALGGWLVWPFVPDPLTDALREAGWVVGDPVSMDDFKALAW
jgi:hypothetical protein